jgi:plasmid stability protein
MARTTLDLDQSVIDDLRRRAAAEGKSMGRVASELLARSLGEADAGPAPKLKWVSRDLGRPRINLEDKEALRHTLDNG